MQAYISDPTKRPKLAEEASKAQQSSDHDDWTLVTPPQSKSVSPERNAFTLLGGQISDQNELASLSGSISDTENREELGRLLPNTRKSVMNLSPKKLNKGPSKICKLKTLAKVRVRLQDKSIKLLDNKPSPVHDEPKMGTNRSPNWPRAPLKLFVRCILYAMPIGIWLFAYKKNEELNILNSQKYDRVFNSIYLGPSSQAYIELKVLEEELVDCIQRENPQLKAGLESIMERWNVGHQDFMDFDSAKSEPFKGLVCYEKGDEWYKKLQRLKSDYNYDIIKMLEKVRNYLTYKILEEKHPALRFRFIVNQIDYQNRLEQRRKDGEIERLKAENFELRRQVFLDQRNEPLEENNGTQEQRGKNSLGNRQQLPKAPTTMAGESALISLQSENRRLRIENGMLKQNLGEKAGTVYVKQSIELEKCERDNSAMRQFHHKVATEVSKGFKQLDLQKTDFGALLHNSDASLNARLNQTWGYLMRLIEETSQILAKNKSIQEELKESRSLNAIIVQEASNLIESDIQSAKSEEKNELSTDTINSTSDEPSKSAEPGRIRIYGTSFEAPPLEDSMNPENVPFGSLRCLTRSTSKECLATKVNWLVKRARLREKLRKDQSRADEPSRTSECRKPVKKMIMSKGRLVPKACCI